MSIAARHGPTTWEDVQALPSDNRRYESVGGVLTVTPAPSRRHQEVLLALYRLLFAAAPPELAVLTAPFDWWISESEWYEPDLLVFRRSAPSERRLEEAPLLVVEVASPSTRLHDLNDKKAAYAANGCPSYWVVDADEPSVLAFALSEAGYEPVARVLGEARFETTTPFPLRFSPIDLIAH
jgi:Uma2 family endonuclease